MKNFFLSLKNNKESRARFWTVNVLVLIALLAAFLRFYQLGQNGTNEYYAATVKSMLTSWHNFFFVSYEPGGSVSVDKPPLGFWIEALSALIFGVNNFAFAFPNALAGVISVLLTFSLVKKPFGRKAGLIAALALAAMPITVAAERNNTIDGMLVCVLLLAAWAFFRSVETHRVGLLMLGAVLVGLAFNIKMLQAYMVLPALFLFYFLGARYKWGQRLLHLTGALVVLLAVSLSWTLIVDAVPASERPFIGSSTNNTVWELVIGHNGLERFESLRQSFSNAAQGAPRLDNNNSTGPGPMGNPPGNTEGTSGGQANGFPGNPAGGPGGPGPRSNPNGQIEQGEQAPLPRSGDSGWMRPGSNGMDGGSGMNGTGTAGILRLFQEPLATQASWLLPGALIGLVLFIIFQRRLGAAVEQKLSVVFWAAWLLSMLTYFSFTQGLWHSYYLIMLGPGIAALFGITFWLLDHLRSWSKLLTGSLVTILSAAVIGFQIYAIYSYHYFANFFAVLLGALWLVSILLYWIKPRSTALATVFMAMIIAPLLWSGLTTLNPQAGYNLPQAFPIANPAEIGQKARTTSSAAQQELVDYLLENTKPNKYLLATLSSREASPFILATSRPVLTFGGYTGSDDIIDVDKLSQMVSSGELRYVLDKGDLLEKKAIYEWVKKNCSVVQSLKSLDSARVTANDPLSTMESRLYDCAAANN
jgi:4-amino-4-deoxy-L-arabinose transferase-like glycosyltransferase